MGDEPTQDKDYHTRDQLWQVNCELVSELLKRKRDSFLPALNINHKAAPAIATAPEII
jgi:hypothetical protein